MIIAYYCDRYSIILQNNKKKICYDMTFVFLMYVEAHYLKCIPKFDELLRILVFGFRSRIIVSNNYV